MKKSTKKQEQIVIQNLEYLKKLSSDQRREIYKKMLKESKS